MPDNPSASDASPTRRSLEHEIERVAQAEFIRFARHANIFGGRSEQRLSQKIRFMPRDAQRGGEHARFATSFGIGWIEAVIPQLPNVRHSPVSVGKPHAR